MSTNHLIELAIPGREGPEETGALETRDGASGPCGGINLLMLSYEFPPLGGGGSHVVHGLSTELVRQGHRVDVVTMRQRGLARHEVVNGVRVRRVSCLRLKKSICTTPEMMSYDLAALLALRRMNGRSYVLNHTHFIFPTGLISLRLASRWKLPYVITAHGSDVPGYNPDRFKLLHRLLAPLWKKVVRGARQVICPSETLRSLILARIPRARTIVIPNGFDPARLRPTLAKEKRILVVSRLFERKGVQHLLRAVDGLDPEYEVQIVGDGPHEEWLAAQATRVDARVRFRGWLDNDSPELKQLYETSSIFVLPSESENFPIVLLEAMAAGQAIVTTHGTGCAEVVGEAALIVPPKDPAALRLAIEQLIAQPELRATLGLAARRRLEERFAWSAVARSHVELYRREAQLASVTA